jgi:hypothetical protein
MRQISTYMARVKGAVSLSQSQRLNRQISFHTRSMPPWKTVMPGAADTADAPVAFAKPDPATL